MSAIRRTEKSAADGATPVGDKLTQSPGKATSGTGGLLFAVHLNNMLHNAAYMMNQSALPFIAKSLGVGNELFGFFTTTSGLVMLIGSPLFGRFGDVYGGQLSLTVSFIGMALVSGMLAVCNSVPFLFLTRLPLLFTHVIPGFQMVVSDVTDDESRAGALGLLGLSLITGMVIGSLFGGVVTENYSPSAACLIAAILSLLSAAHVWMSVPRQTKQTKKDDKPKPKKSVFDAEELKRLLRVPGVAKLLGMKFLLWMSCVMIQGLLTVILTDVFDLGAQDSGIFMMIAGIVGAVFQVVAVDPLSKRFSDMSLIYASAFLIAVGGVMMSGATTVWHMYVAFAPNVFGNVMFDVVINSALSKAVPQEDTGTVMGLADTMYHLTMVVCPVLSAFLLENVGFPSLGLTSAAINGLLVLFMLL